MIRRSLSYFLLFCFIGIVAVIFFPPGRPRWQARRASCQSNLKQIGFALRQYAQDNGDRLPSGRWGVPVTVYAKTISISQCPETPYTPGTSDYFLNAHLTGAPLKKISSPMSLVLLGDGLADAPLDATLSLLPEAWRTDENSPAWRHGGTANYLFADGHVKALTVDHVSHNFRSVKP